MNTNIFFIFMQHFFSAVKLFRKLFYSFKNAHAVSFNYLNYIQGIDSSYQLPQKKKKIIETAYVTINMNQNTRTKIQILKKDVSRVFYGNCSHIFPLNNIIRRVYNCNFQPHWIVERFSVEIWKKFWFVFRNIRFNHQQKDILFRKFHKQIFDG